MGLLELGFQHQGDRAFLVGRSSPRQRPSRPSSKGRVAAARRRRTRGEGRERERDRESSSKKRTLLCVCWTMLDFDSNLVLSCLPSRTGDVPHVMSHMFGTHTCRQLLGGCKLLRLGLCLHRYLRLVSQICPSGRKAESEYV